jgi:hypothetical protein
LPFDELLKETIMKRINAVLWTVQALLAALFLFAGSTKLIMPIEALTAQSHLPGLFLRFIGLAEFAGALGLILPGIFRIQPRLTPLAASGLVIIMIGATVTTAAQGLVVMAAIPFVTGVLAALVAYGRTRLAPHGTRGSGAAHRLA